MKRYLGPLIAIEARDPSRQPDPVGSDHLQFKAATSDIIGGGLYLPKGSAGGRKNAQTPQAHRVLATGGFQMGVYWERKPGRGLFQAKCQDNPGQGSRF